MEPSEPERPDELRDRILTGRLQPGDRLDLDEITREFGISRTPVREALLELSYEGLVTVTPRSGITVVGITPEDAVDNFAVLAALAGKAAEWATVRITQPQLAELKRLAVAVDEAPDVVTANRQFHRAVNLAVGSPRLLTYLRQAVRVVPGSFFELFPEQQRRSHTEHAALLDAIGRGTQPRPAPSPRPTSSRPALRSGSWLRTNAGPVASEPAR